MMPEPKDEKIPLKGVVRWSYHRLLDNIKDIFSGICEDITTFSLAYKKYKNTEEKARISRVIGGVIWDVVKFGSIIYLSTLSCHEVSKKSEEIYNHLENQVQEYMIKPFFTSELHQPSDTTYINPIQNNSSDISLQVFETPSQSLDSLL